MVSDRWPLHNKFLTRYPLFWQILGGKKSPLSVWPNFSIFNAQWAQGGRVGMMNVNCCSRVGICHKEYVEVVHPTTHKYYYCILTCSMSAWTGRRRIQWVRRARRGRTWQFRTFLSTTRDNNNGGKNSLESSSYLYFSIHARVEASFVTLSIAHPHACTQDKDGGRSSQRWMDEQWVRTRLIFTAGWSRFGGGHSGWWPPMLLLMMMMMLVIVVWSYLQ